MSKGNRKRRKAAGLLPTRERCVARNRFGERCKRYPIEGGVVCPSHGGAAPQVRAKALERLALAQDDAASLLIRFAHDDKVPYPVRLAAVKDILDRGGIGTKQELEVTLRPWEEAIEVGGILVDTDDEPDFIEGEVVGEEIEAPPVSAVLAWEDSEPSSTRGKRYRDQ
ncbi:hypothetical protein [Pimelobacter simplex]|uniref:hypothetical protein n=1 Tax=Nocardioides simplex TaxID=2045 RepID=UPI003AAB5A4D